MTAKVRFCDGKFYFYFHRAKFWAKLSLSWWHTSLHLVEDVEGQCLSKWLPVTAFSRAWMSTNFTPTCEGGTALLCCRAGVLFVKKNCQNLEWQCFAMWWYLKPGTLHEWPAWNPPSISILLLAPWIQEAPVSQQEDEGNGSFLSEMICPKISWLLNRVVAGYPFSATNEEGQCKTTVFYTWVNCCLVKLLCVVEYWRCIPTLIRERYLL